MVIWRLDRLARSTKDLLAIIETIEKAEAEFKSIAETWADTISPNGMLLLAVIAGLGESERKN